MSVSTTVSTQHASATTSTPPQLGSKSVGAAIRTAWVYYVALLFAPFFLFLYVAWTLNQDNPASRDRSVSDGWFLGSMAYMAIVVPAAIFFRSRMFKSYWKGEVISPSSYLTGMVAVWVALEVGGILSLVGCLVSQRLLPGIIPAAVAFMLFTPLWPSGRSMIVKHVGDSDDPSKYEEPH